MDIIKQKLNQLLQSFEQVLYEEDDIFLKNMETKNLAGDDPKLYQFWEWTQGVGLYGLWKIYCHTGKPELLDKLLYYYERQMKIGLPAKNINTTAPMLTLSFLAEKTGNPEYHRQCSAWADWLVTSLPKTKEGGFQHLTSDTLNEQELWDDTLFMAVLFLAKMGVLDNRPEWIEEAQYQFLLHAKYLTDKKTGLWFHGWTFHGRHNFTNALWGRGNSWVTMAIPEFFEIAPGSGAVRRYLTGILQNQVEALAGYQNESGMWHTLIDDPSSYAEASATSGFGYGILKAVHEGLVDSAYAACARRALAAILDYIDENGVLRQVSYGTPMGRESIDFYRQIELRPMPYGQAMAILFLSEALKTDEAAKTVNP